jgi:hypothetical protein
MSVRVEGRANPDNNEALLKLCYQGGFSERWNQKKLAVLPQVADYPIKDRQNLQHMVFLFLFL